MTEIPDSSIHFDTLRAQDDQKPPYLRKIESLNIISTKEDKIYIWNIALREHYKSNPHHPEYYSDPSKMDNLNKKHMLCDLLASHLGSQWKQDSQKEWTIPRAANVCKNWSNWEMVQDFYAGSFDETEILSIDRWSKKRFFSYEKIKFIAFLKNILHEKLKMEEFITGLYAFKCVRYYMDDLQWHQYAIVKVGQELFPEDEELMAVLTTHDNDKWDALMIAAYVLKWVFDEEVIELDENFDILCFDSFIYFKIEEGKEEMKNMVNSEQMKDLSSVKYKSDDHICDCWLRYSNSMKKKL
ncbi:hypothetical protein AVEN_167043-1 [Araneus ventricosus]|uniref:Uncharacterized protein n=1 Tax=Araneus ventricosus TaxID=182803 RepID=A0A4Y2SJ72_ARAVE|nr:hypothetical protein AVEN_167043-1 [Araneus ventricosus]